MKQIMIGCICAVLFGGIVFAQAQEGCKVEKIVVAVNVADKEPVGETKEFTASTLKVFCWTKISCAQVPCTIKHVWFKGDEKKLEVPLTVKFATMRTWSNKNVTPGEWRVEVQDEAGKVLASEKFSVK